MRKPVKIAVLAGVGAVLVAGASSAAAVAAPDDQRTTRAAAATATADTTTSTSPEPVTRSSDRATGATEIDYADAEAAARKAVPGSRVTEIDRDVEDGLLVWEVELTRNGVEYEVDVDAHDGRIVKVENDRHDDDGRHDDHDHDHDDDHGDHGHDGDDD